QRSHLRIRDLAAGQRLGQLRQSPQRLRRAHLLARRGQRNLTAPVQPFGAALVAPLGPAEAVVEVANQLEHLVGRRMQLARETTDGGLELVDLAAVDFDTRGRSRHLEPPSNAFLYT